MPLPLVTALFVAAVTLTTVSADFGPDVVGGRPATEPYPFIVSMQTVRGSHFCGAALIRPNWVVTARHCVEHQRLDSLRVRAGSTNRTSDGTVARVSRVVVHPGGANDVAVFQLSSAVPGPPIEVADSVPVGSPVRLLGWGDACDPCAAPQPVVLQELDTSVLPDSRCGTADIDLCVSNVDGWRGACYGDSGGPALLHVNGVWRLAGTTSAGTGGYCGQAPAIYKDSAYHRAWIDSVVG